MQSRSGRDQLVLEFYKKAAVSSTDKGLTFKFKTKKEMGFYTNRPIDVPVSGGILGEVSAVPGPYKGADKDRLPAEEHSGFHTNLTMAPYSKSRDTHLLAHLSFPEDAPVDFKERFKAIIKSFSQGEEPDHALSKNVKRPSLTGHSDVQVVVKSEKLPDHVHSGPLEEQRTTLLREINDGREKGVGISAYAAEFNRIEAMVKAGDAEATIAPRLESLSNLLSKQLETAGSAYLSGDVAGCKLTVYLSADDNEAGSVLGTHYWWQDHENSVHVRANLSKGQKYYLHIKLDPPSNDRVFLGYFKISGNYIFEASRSNVIDSRPEWWKVSIAGFGKEYHEPAIAPGKSVYVIQCPVLYKMHPDLMPLMDPLVGTGHDGHVYFSTAIVPQ